MSFLYGDLTAAPFATNFLEDLRDVIDFAAGIAEADQRVVTADATREALHRQADEDAARLEALARSVLAAAGAADKGRDDSAASTFAADLAGIVAVRHQAAEAALREKLAADIRALEAATQAARGDYFVLLEEYLLEHLLPGAAQTLRIELVAPKKDERRYVAELRGESELGLDWSIEMTVAEEGAWKAPLRVDRIADGLAILAPQKSGLIKKEIKLKKHKLDRHFVTKVVQDDTSLRVELRSEIGEPEGFDLSAAIDGDLLSVAKTGEAGDETLGAFAVAAEDRATLFDLAAKLRAMGSELPKKRLLAASLDGLPFDGTNREAQPKLVELVSRLVAKLAPTVDNIAARSRSEDELVLRRKLDDGRREEIFMSKSRLRENFEPLDEAHRDLFDALASALDATPPAEVLNIVISEPPPSHREDIRSEVPLVRRKSSGSMQAVVVPKPAPLPVEPAVEPAPEPEPEPAPPPAPSPEPPPASTRGGPPSSRNAELVATLKHIRGIAKDGHLDEAFRQWAALFSSAAFAALRPEDQRQALKLMLFGKPEPTPSDEMRTAHRAALPVLQALIVGHRDPADYEMLGMAYVALDEPDKGSEIFKKALEIERARNPASDLCGNLMRRVSQL